MSASMSFVPFAVSLVMFRRLSRSEDVALAHPTWKPILQKAMYASIALFVVQIIFSIHFTVWLWHLFVIGLMAYVLSQKDLQEARAVTLAIMPVEVISFLTDILSHGFPKLYEKIEDYADAAVFFALLWAGAMGLYARNRQKALDKERFKRRQEEQMYRITEAQKAALEVTVSERTAQITQQKEELQKSLAELQATQAQLIQAEKMASLGELTAGIAHEIQNPLNFVNNFSEVSVELAGELKDALAQLHTSDEDKSNIAALIEDLVQNQEKINFHGKRADAIVKGMLQHSRTSAGQKEPTDLNALADEYLRLSYHGLRAKDKTFNATMNTEFDPEVGKIMIIPQDIGRVLMNLFTNAFYSISQKKKMNAIADYEPTVKVSTKRITQRSGEKIIEIRVRDNGMGIPQKVLDKIYQPFFTTKPVGQGTGLGLSLSYDTIVKVHGGQMNAETKEGEFAEFIITLNNV